jgi:hypothetical protein
MNHILRIKYALIFTLSFLPSVAFADTKWELQSDENNLTLSGSCEADVRIELYETDNFEVDPLYTAVAPCSSESFSHDDNLLKWGMADGTYRLVVESNRSTVRSFTIKEPPMTTEEAVAREAREKGLPTDVGLSANQIFENAQASFGQKLYSLETDLITMQESLRDTTYPDFIKIGLGATLGLVEGATKKLAEAFFIVEQRDFVETVVPETGTVEGSLPEIAPETSTEPTLESEAEESVTQETAPSEEVTPETSTIE